jgi:hypothetical protein
LIPSNIEPSSECDYPFSICLFVSLDLCNFHDEIDPGLLSDTSNTGIDGVSMREYLFCQFVLKRVLNHHGLDRSNIQIGAIGSLGKT